MTDFHESTALIVDEDDHVAALLEFMLQRDGFMTTRCAQGNEASRFIAENPPVAVVIQELVLPYRDGFELIAQIRGSSTWRDVPIIVLSSRNVEDEIVRAFKQGANDYVSKPYSPRELLARIERLAPAPGVPT